MNRRPVSFKTILVAVLLLLLVSSAGRAQAVDDLQHSVEAYHKNTLQEQVFVHTDKDTYLPGEVLWFKAYSVNASNHHLLALNKVMYIELLDGQHHAVVQAKVNLKDGLADGSLYIPVTVNNGTYGLRAYTSWMKNFSPDLYFEKNITLVNPLKAIAASGKQTLPAFDIQFFPEGGGLVKGLRTKVGFKAVGRDGLGIAVSGAVIDQQGDTVARFRSLKYGMGSFVFSPQQEGTYKAVATAGAVQLRKELPPVSATGYVMGLQNDGSGKLEVTLHTGGLPDGPVYALVSGRQQVTAAQSTALVQGLAHFSIDERLLGEGISRITIFDSSKQPVCERLYFKRPAQKMVLAAAPDQQQYASRKKVTVNVSAKDEGKTVSAADLSMSVYRIDSLQLPSNSDIFTYLWLSSALKGQVENPGYYFATVNGASSEELDNLLLTQGWSRFDWSAPLSRQAPRFSYLPEYAGHIITARVLTAAGSPPANTVSAYLSIPGKRVQTYNALSDSAGYLYFNIKDFYGAGELVLQTVPVAGASYRVEVLSPFSERFPASGMPGFNLRSGMLPALKAHSLSAQVTNAYHGSQIREFYKPKLDTSAFYGKPSRMYNLDDFTRFTTMEEVLREYVKEDNIVKSRGKFRIKVLSDRGFLEGGDPLVLMDGVPVFDMNKVMNIDPLKVNKLEVVAAMYNYGAASLPGIFSFTSYKADLAGMELDPAAVVLDYEGLQLSRVFYAPVYETDEQRASRMPDFRNLLYWNPSVQPGGAVSFYTSDLPGKYMGLLQGITNSGDVASQTFTFEVK